MRSPPSVHSGVIMAMVHLGWARLSEASPFWRLWLAQAVSSLGDWMTNVALVLLVYRLSGHPGAAALVLLAKLLPRCLVYPFGGLLADRYDRRTLLVVTDLLRAGLALSLLFCQTPEAIGWVLVATLLSQTLASIFNPTLQASLPSIVADEQLGQANARIAIVKELGFVLGPLLGLALAAASDLWLVFIVDGATFILSAGLIAGLGGLAKPVTSRLPLRVGHDLAVGLAAIRADQNVRGAVIAQALVCLLGATLNVLLVPLLLTLWRSPEDLVGVLYAAVGVGSLLGSLLGLRLATIQFRWALLASLLASGLVGIVLGFAPWFWVGCLLLGLLGLLGLINDVAAAALIQTSVADDRLGRVFGLLYWVIALAQVGAAVLGWMASLSEPVWLVVGLSVGLLLSGLLLTRLRPAPAMSRKIASSPRS